MYMTLAGVTNPAPGGENAKQNAYKQLALFNVEYERLNRAKFLEERKSKKVCFEVKHVESPLQHQKVDAEVAP